ncbi:hypothetical protein [Alcanivorax sp.]|jgi:hypothetical protein|uniref:hypothetical protein n=1 Tax=Alcanivorax sp. TaxID=1872427 RepID=UPI0032D98870
MRFLFILTTLLLALAGCNGGEDFSDAIVPGCPAGAGCDPSSRGDVLVELAGPHVSNLGYTCTGTNVVFFTSDTDQQSVDSDGNVVTVPAFNALCPDGAQGVEFLIGNALFEGNYLSLGSIEFPSQEAYTRYAVTVADLKNSPFREAASDAQSRNVAAFIQGLDVDPATSDFVKIPDAVHEVYDNDPETYEQPIDTAVYADFRSDWDPFFVAVNAQLASGSLAGMDPDPNVPLAKVQLANGYTFSGNYSFRSCIFITCQDDNSSSAASKDIVRINLPGRLIDDTPLGQPPLILPNGKVMGLGFAERGEGQGEFSRELVAFTASTAVNEKLQFENGSVISIELDGDTDLAVQGRFLNKIVYNNFLPENGVGKTDLELNYPSLSSSLASNDEGALTGTLVGDAVDLPLSGELEAAPQAEPNQTVIDDLALAGPFTVRLMRACLSQDDAADCTSIPNLDIETADDGSGNYFPEINNKSVTDEQPRADYYGSAVFCLDVIADISSPDYGVIMAGPADGSCPTSAANSWAVGFVTRTLADSNSANISLLLAPDASQPDVAANFGVTINGRVDIDDACVPLYRTGDVNFDAGLRALWVDGYYPYIQQKEWVDALPAPADPDDTNNVNDLTEDQQEMLVALSQGAVQFFAGAPVPGNTCDPANQP